MQQLNVHVSDRTQRAFRRRAIRHYRNNKEYCEGMRLRRVSGEFHIEAYVPLKIDHADKCGVDINDDSFQAFKEQCLAEGYEWGTIHTHITCDTAPSTPDLAGAIEEGETLIGVMEIETRKGRAWSRIDYWSPQVPARVTLIRE